MNLNNCFLYLVLYSTLLLIVANTFSQDLKSKKEEDEKKQSMIEKYFSFLTEENEIISRRTLTSQHYIIDNSFAIAVINSKPIFYRANNSSLTKISDKIITNPENNRNKWYYRNEANDLLFYFSKNADKCLVKGLDGESLMSIALNPIFENSSISIHNNTIALTALDSSFKIQWEQSGSSLKLECLARTLESVNTNFKAFEINWLVGSDLIESRKIEISENQFVSFSRFSLSNDLELKVSSEKIFNRKSIENLNDGWSFKQYSIFSIKDEKTIVATASGRVFRDATSITKFDNYLRIQNTTPTGCATGYRSWVKYDISSIPDGSSITRIEQDIYCTELLEDFWDPLGYDIHRVDNDPISSTPVELWADIFDGAIYEGDEWVSNPPSWEWCYLDPPAGSDFKAALTLDWFCLGFMVKCNEDDADYYAVFNGVEDNNPPFIVVRYDAPSGIKDVSSQLYSYKLFPNYPNPFNPVTTIRFTIPEQTFTTLKIYDVLGTEIAILVNQEQPAGEYEVEFNGTGLTSEVYFYRLQAGDFVETKKMILMK